MARNPILAQRALREQKAREAAEKKAATKAPPPPPGTPKTAPGPEEKAPGPAELALSPEERLEALPDADLHAKAQALLGVAYKSSWTRDQLKAKLLAAGCVG